VTVPYKKSRLSKTKQVRQMFDRIAWQYDRLNHLLSLSLDKTWRRRAVNLLKKYQPLSILDIATGTGDFAIAVAKLGPQHITGVDISEKMIDIGRKKIINLNLQELIHLEKGNAENLLFGDKTFDAVTVAFGVRNFEHLTQGLSEMYRVLKPKGVTIILELSRPNSACIQLLYTFYAFKLLPWLGRIISKNHVAYTYLPESIYTFPEGKKFLDILTGCGFSNVKQKRLTFGIATVYTAEK
jgi:demethylmenaquinone methyltransferase/2-methoxy-6-polyprenyl-1,4-benzoquinol methylase